MKNKIKLSVLILLCFALTQANSQCKEWNWPEDKKTAEEKVALLQDAVNAKRYKQAIKPLNWLIANTPQINSSIYIHGTTIYDALASREKNPVPKKRYADSLMIIYDLRVQQCGQIEYVLNRKALSAYKFYINTADAPKALSLMDSAFSVNKNDITDGTLFPYMQTLVIVQSKFKMLTEDDIMSRYEMLTKITDYKISKATANSKSQLNLKKTKKDIDEWLLKIIKPDCDFVRKSIVPKFKNNPEDLTSAKRIFSFMLQGKCTDDPIWLAAGEAIFAKEKDFGLGKNIALRFFSLEKNDKAEMYFNESLALASTRTDSSEMYYYKGALENKKVNKIQAREYYLLAIKLDSKRKEAFERIGDLYYGSFDECAQKQNQADDRVIYLAAYNYYAKAGNTSKMSLAKKQFPSKEEVFLLNYKVGDKFMVGCWINEQVAIRTRD